ncbi:MAG: hypothetical protein ABJB12_23515 [Pseudomonadota bacterium]
MKGLFSTVAVAVVLQFAGLASAAEETVEPTPTQVRSAAEAFDRGREAYKQEEYAEAAEQFESADANAPSAAALELAIRARDKAGQLDRAATLAALALARHPDDPNIQKIAPSIIARAKTELFELSLKCDDPCDVTVAGKLAPGRRSTERTIYVAPGKYTVLAGWSGDRSSSQQVAAARGAQGTLEFETPAAPAVPAAVAAPLVSATPSEKPEAEDRAHGSGTLSPAVFWVGVGLTAVAGGVSIWSGLDTQNHPGPDKVREACQASSPDCQSLYQQGLDRQHRTNILIGVTAGLGVATGVIGAFFTDWSGAPRKPPPDPEQAARAHKKGFSIEPWVAVGSGASVGALGRF